ncbi:MAG: DEAD/DEAH box helicase family protein, partial [Oscillospiraceae bacterium]|nr:DEAD/DEAH box helicase family protein [Oscillospiraceae bacterium]
MASGFFETVPFASVYPAAVHCLTRNGCPPYTGANKPATGGRYGRNYSPPIRGRAMKLYAWQRDCLDAWESNGCRGIVRAVTGAGKTVLSLAAIDRLSERFPDLRVKVVVPTIPLAQQWKTALLHHFPEERRPGFFGGGARDDPDRATMIYILNSARGALSAHIRRDFALRRHVLLICDECHHCQSPQNRRIFDFLTEDAPALYACLGLSATPFGTGDDAVLTRALGPEVCRYGFGEAEEAGVVSPFTVCEVSAPFLPDELSAYGALTDEIRILTARLYQA